MQRTGQAFALPTFRLVAHAQNLEWLTGPHESRHGWSLSIEVTASIRLCRRPNAIYLGCLVGVAVVVVVALVENRSGHDNQQMPRDATARRVKLVSQDPARGSSRNFRGIGSVKEVLVLVMLMLMLPCCRRRYCSVADPSSVPGRVGAKERSEETSGACALAQLFTFREAEVVCASTWH